MLISEATDEGTKAKKFAVTQQVIKPGFDLELSGFKMSTLIPSPVSQIFSTKRAFHFMLFNLKCILCFHL